MRKLCYITITCLLLTSCGTVTNFEGKELEPTSVTIGLPEWLAKVSVNYKVTESEKVRTRRNR